jgi:bifunctional non-homologous end joining protein LigD
MVVARYRCESYVSDTMMYEFSLPTKSDKVPVGTDWIHQIKYDGYRMLVIRDRDRVRLVSRGGHDWADRFPLIVAGEVVVLDKAGVSDFDALSSRKHNKRAQLYAFDPLAGDDKDLRGLPLSIRKVGLAQLLSDPVDGIFIAEYEQGDIGDTLFRVACNMGLEGIVSKHLDRAYGAGRCAHWIKIKNPTHIRLTAGSGMRLFCGKHGGSTQFVVHIPDTQLNR